VTRWLNPENEPLPAFMAKAETVLAITIFMTEMISAAPDAADAHANLTELEEFAFPDHLFEQAPAFVGCVTLEVPR
jgi:hypothetical protein